jgi:hypothetical protein
MTSDRKYRNFRPINRDKRALMHVILANILKGSVYLPKLKVYLLTYLMFYRGSTRERLLSESSCTNVLAYRMYVIECRSKSLMDLVDWIKSMTYLFLL